jgi:predicted nucleic acid-binding protein
MYLLDTNILSELQRPHRANAKVSAWARSVAPADLFLSAVTIMEIETGARMLLRRDTARGAVLRDWIDRQVLPAFAGRILPFDAAVATRCAELHVADRRPERDAMIAATALVHGLKVATRNVADFESTGVKLMNPWD